MTDCCMTDTQQFHSVMQDCGNVFTVLTAKSSPKKMANNSDLKLCTNLTNTVQNGKKRKTLITVFTVLRLKAQHINLQNACKNVLALSRELQTKTI